MSILEVSNLSHSFGDNLLFNNVDMNLYGGDKMGITGLNGVGKSTFINILVQNVIPDKGFVKWNPKIKIGYLDQHAKINTNLTVKEYLKEAFAELYEIEKKIESIGNEISNCSDSNHQAQLINIMSSCQETLNDKGFYSINSYIDKVSAGLGIIAFGLDTNIGRLSGGQRAKVMLAKLLLIEPDVLLLDEPTNFLDKEHISWLTKYLNNFEGGFILVSHDFPFLNNVVNCISHIEFGNMTRFNGNFEAFERQKEQKAAEYIKNYNSQQKEIAKLEDYIRKNGVRASTAAMAKSRQKKLDKIEVMQRPTINPKPTFSFLYKEAVAKTVLKIDKLTVGYSAPLLPPVTLKLDLGQKIAVTGFNGIGKTTFLKTLAGILPRLSGNFKFSDKVEIGYYEQENKWDYPDISPFQEIKNNYPAIKDKDVRNYLSRCGLKGEQVIQRISTLSGGEQSKVKVCKLILKPCNLLILDEPTNHLDVNAIEQLKYAILEFKGAVLFVSHDKSFCDDVADDVLDLEKLFD